MKYFHHCNFPLEFSNILSLYFLYRKKNPIYIFSLPTRLNATSSDIEKEKEPKETFICEHTCMFFQFQFPISFSFSYIICVFFSTSFITFFLLRFFCCCLLRAIFICFSRQISHIIISFLTLFLLLLLALLVLNFIFVFLFLLCIHIFFFSIYMYDYFICHTIALGYITYS